VKLPALLLTTLGSLMLSTVADAASLQNWRFDRTQNQLEIRTDQGVQPRAVLVQNPTRLVIDLPGVIWGRPKLNETVGGAIRSLRIAQFDPQTTRIVVELAPGYTLDPQKIQFRGVFANYWTVQLPTPELAEPSTAPENPPSSVAQEVPPSPLSVPQPEQIEPPRQPLTLPLRQPATLPPPRLFPNQLIPRPTVGQRVVVIDPGHGGPDPGAVGIGGLREVDVIMPVAFRLAELLRQQGMQVVMTREADIDLGLEPRVQIAQRANADLFVSLHANAISLSRPEVNGVETFYHSSGLELAQSIQRNILQSMGMRDRGVKQARFYVLRRTSMPSVLVEVGFVTGADDAPRLRDPEFLNRMAEAIARGILEYTQTRSR